MWLLASDGRARRLTLGDVRAHDLRWMDRSSVAVTGVVGLIGFSCSALVSSDVEQCRTDQDCTSRGFTATRCEANLCVTPAVKDPNPINLDAAAPADPRWACLGKVTWGTEDVSQTVRYRGRYVSLLKEAPLTGMDVKACSRVDPGCISPYATGTTDDKGYVTLDVPKFFQGYWYASAPPSVPELLPSISLALPPPGESNDTAEVSPSMSAHLATRAELAMLLEQMGGTVDDGLGTLFGLVLDCEGKPASGVSLRLSVIDKSTLAYYTDVNGIPTVMAQETGPRGEAGFVNVPTGPLQLEATVTALSRRLGTYAVPIKAGHLTLIPITPAPWPPPAP